MKREGCVISTLHAVKGLEYDRVYIMNVNEGSMPYRKAVLEAHLEEERRLFYVGMTRAKKKLCLCYVRLQYEKEREPSRFLRRPDYERDYLLYKDKRRIFGKNMEHMIGEKLLEIGLEREYGRKLAFEPRAKGEHGKPFFTLLPKIHYNISHSGKYVMCLFAGEEVGIDIQIHKKVNYERILEETGTCRYGEGDPGSR